MFLIDDYSLHLIDLEIIDFKDKVLNNLYLKMLNDEITYEEYYDGDENNYYWNLIKLYSFYLYIKQKTI